MSKELEAWAEVKAYVEYCLNLRKWCNAILWTSTYDFLKPFIDKIDKQFKALEIIKEKRVNADLLYYSKNLDDYNRNIVMDNRKLTQEEFDLLKEILL